MLNETYTVYTFNNKGFLVPASTKKFKSKNEADSYIQEKKINGLVNIKENWGMEKLRKNLSHLPNLVFTSNDEKENGKLWGRKGLILFYGFILTALVLYSIYSID